MGTTSGTTGAVHPHARVRTSGDIMDLFVAARVRARGCIRELSYLLYFQYIYRTCAINPVFFNDSDDSDNFIQCQSDNRTRDKRQPLSRR